MDIKNLNIHNKFFESNNKRVRIMLVIIISIIVLFIFSIFIKYYYKNVKTGNNITDKTLQEIENYILNINSYRAKIELKIESNKNSNKYIIEQKYVKPNLCKQVVEEPKNIEGLTIKYDGNNLEISNSKLNLNTIYENYKYVSDNILWLSTFIENYKANGGTIFEERGIVVMQTKCKINSNDGCEKLYIDRNANKIVNLIIEDMNKKNKIYITYNEMDIDNLNKENILAFKLEDSIKSEI